ncbi:MAG: hypothetical protein KJ044_11830 [Planctomycetes bacterium]|nr:hypothetical protein [Planctomycetota bacterium]
MRIVFRALAALALAGLVLNLSLAQKSLKEIPESEHEKLRKEGTRESHQGPDHPMQGNTSDQAGRFGGPDPYGPENFKQFGEKNERHLNDPQWQLKIDLYDPKSIVVNYPDGTSREYWYVLFRVINNNVRQVKSTTLPEPNPEEVDLGRPPEPLEIRGGNTPNFEGVPVNCHIDFELQVFTRNVERDPWDTEWPRDPEEIERPSQLPASEQAEAERRANIKRTYRAVSDPFVLQRIAEKEEMWEWNGNFAGTPEPVTLLHPLSDFQRQMGRGFDRSAPDLSGPRCLPYRAVVLQGNERVETTRYVAVFADNTYAGIFGTGDRLPDGARLVTSTDDRMWGKLTQRRYEPGDCIDRSGRVLRANDPGYLNARIAGGNGEGENSYGLIGPNHPAVGQGVTMPHFLQYKDGDKVLFNHDTGITIPGRRNDTFKINGVIINAADPRYAEAEAIDAGTEKFGANVVGKPVKMVDSRGRALRKYLVTYQAGDVITQAEWDIWRARIGPGVLARYTNLNNIVGRPLTADDPLVGLPKIKLGYFVGPADRNQPETIKRGVNTGRKGPKGEIILTTVDYKTGRPYDPRTIQADDFMRDPDGEYTTNRVAPIPEGASLRPGEEYVYAPLGGPGENAVPVPRFDQHGAWADWHDEFSGVRVPMSDEKGDLVRDEFDQLLYLKEYEYEYVYLYHYASEAQEDEGFKGQYGGDRWKLVQEEIRMMVKRGPAGEVDVAPLSRLIYENREITEPEVLDGYESRDAEGKVSYLTREEYAQANGKEPGREVVKVKIVRARKTTEPVVVGVFADGVRVPAGARVESWQDAEARAKADGFEVRSRTVIRYVNRFRDRFVSQGGDVRRGKAVDSGDFEETEVKDNALEENMQTWRRWTVPPPMV